MAANSISSCNYRLGSSRRVANERRSVIILSCLSKGPAPASASASALAAEGQQDPSPKNEDKVVQKRLQVQPFKGMWKELGKRMKVENLRPKHKGDWKDLLLMSISFAVYVYISQKIVCAYCAWISMLR